MRTMIYEKRQSENWRKKVWRQCITMLPACRRSNKIFCWKKRRCCFKKQTLHRPCYCFISFSSATWTCSSSFLGKCSSLLIHLHSNCLRPMSCTFYFHCISGIKQWYFYFPLTEPTTLSAARKKRHTRFLMPHVTELAEIFFFHYFIWI